MMQRPQVSWLADGQRLHLHFGPIDMIVGISGPGRRDAVNRAIARFDTLLEELVAELPRLRAAHGPDPAGETALRMTRAVAPFASEFITPMAAVAGAGADTILAAILSGSGVDKAFVNNGGDVAFHISGGHEMHALIASDPPGHITIRRSDACRGIATSGWQGRSHSLGIADSVTALAASAAQADAAATMIANAVNLPAHPAIARSPARDLAPDSDLGDRLVTTHVAPLSRADINSALDAGAAFARRAVLRGLIAGAALLLQGETRLVGNIPLIQQKVSAHA